MLFRPRATAPGRNRFSAPKGATHAVSQAAQIINFPLAQEVGRQLNDFVVALKAPKENESSAQALIDAIQDMVEVLDNAALQLEVIDLGGDLGEYWLYLQELQHFHDQLRRTIVELKELQSHGYMSKLMFQADIYQMIVQRKEELANDAWRLLTRLAIFGFTIAFQNIHSLSQMQYHLQLSDQRSQSLVERMERMESSVSALGRTSGGNLIVGISVVLFV